MADTNNASGGNSQSQPSNRSFMASAQETLGDAYEATLGAVKDHPMAAAAIAAGTAAAVGGAVYAASQMRGSGGGNGGSSNSKK